MLLAFKFRNGGDLNANFVKKVKFFTFSPPVKIGEGWVRSLSRYFKHGLGPNLCNACDWRAARQAQYAQFKPVIYKLGQNLFFDPL